MLDRKLKQHRIFTGVSCGRRCVLYAGSLYGQDVLFCGYLLAGCHTASGGAAGAGFYVMGKSVAAYGYVAGGEFYAQPVLKTLSMGDLEKVLGRLADVMASDGVVMGDVAWKLKNMPVKEPVLKSLKDIQCKETGNRVFGLDGVVVSLGFDAMPFSLFLGCSCGVFAACLADSIAVRDGSSTSRVFLPVYETTFVSGSSGNNFFVALKHQKAVVPGGKVIYRLGSDEFFSRFYSVGGVAVHLAGSCRWLNS